ncbi:MAG: DUF362 domain-containing protein [Kiritimatiellae bacterium]|nr:DUF362 domain-containing protein [Kiritimatiellia bacterium]
MSANKSNRREFIKRMSAAAGVAAGSGVLAAAFHNRNLVPTGEQAKTIPSFAVPGTGGIVAIAEGTDHALAVQAALQELGGMTRFIKAGDRVLIKPNCAFDRPAHFGATSSPTVTGEVVRQCVALGAEVRVIDNPINDPEGCFVKSGIMEAVQAAGAEVWLPSPALFGRVKVGTLRIPEWEALYRPLTWADKLIGIPTVKTHNLCGATLTMKNWYGLLGGGRNRLHQAIHDVIADLAQFIRPTLVVLDGSRLLVANGPTGGSPSDVRPGHVVAAGTDQVALDSFGAELLGFAPTDIEYIGKAAQLGRGQIERSKLNLFKKVRAVS